MLNNPDKKVSSIWMESGFGSEQTFFKAFRAVTGMSPREWISQTND
jgi:AraC-like DNA-binding protein